MGTWPSGISAITLFVEDLAATKAFYIEVFGLPLHYEDDTSAVFDFGNTLINLLKVEEAPELIGPAKVGSPDAGSRFQFTIGVDDVDAMCAQLTARGVAAERPDRSALGHPDRGLPRSGGSHLGDREVGEGPTSRWRSSAGSSCRRGLRRSRSASPAPLRTHTAR